MGIPGDEGIKGPKGYKGYMGTSSSLNIILITCRTHVVSRKIENTADGSIHVLSFVLVTFQINVVQKKCVYKIACEKV